MAAAAGDEPYVFQLKWPTEPMAELCSPCAIAVDPSGNIIVADTYNHCIQKFTSDGVLITKWGGLGRL